MNFNAVCRTCLANGNLIPIFAGSVDHKRYTAAIFITTGIKVYIDDGLPQKMCTSCISFSNDSLKFRKQCKDAQATLLQVKQEWGNAAERVDSAAAHSKDCNGEGLRLETKTGDERKTDEDVSIKSEDDSEAEDYNSEALYTAEEDLFQLPGAEAAPAGPPPQLALGCFVRLERFPLQEFLHSHTCETCLVTFSSPSSLNSHQCTSSVEEYVDKINDDTTEMRFQSFCAKDLDILGESKKVQIEKKFATHSAKEDCENLVPHSSDDVELVRQDENSYFVNNCVLDSSDIICSQDFSTNTSFDPQSSVNNVQRKHQVKYSCHLCKEEFGQKLLLRKHMKGHADKKPISCIICNKQFKKKKALSYHIKCHHTPLKYSCDVCKKGMVNKVDLVRHMLTHTGEKCYSCDLCKKEFALKHSLAKHIESHTAKPQLSCKVTKETELCSKPLNNHSAKEDGDNLDPHRSDDAELVNEDENSHSAIESVLDSSDICSQEFSTSTSFIKPLKSALTRRAKNNKTTKKNRFDIHRKPFTYPSEMIGRTTLHSGEKPYGCDVCKKQFIFNGNLISHMNLHIGKKYHSCGVCGRWFGRKDHQTRHVKTHKGVQLYRCDICRKDFALKLHLAEHIENHNTEKLSSRKRRHVADQTRTRAGEKPIIPCDICNKQFKCSKSFVKHLLSHTGGNTYISDTSKKDFAPKSQLKKVSKVKTDQNILSGKATSDKNTKKVKYSCHMCKEEFEQKRQLSKHMKGHADQNPISCSICDKQFTKKKVFSYHMRAYHMARKYICDICNKGKVRKSDLVKHMRVHTGEKPYVCHVCGKQFTHDSGLAKHVRLHGGYRPYPCTVCSKRFTVSEHLSRHMLTHTGEKRYSCDLCKKEFALKHALAKHIESHIAKPKFSCKFCSKLFWSQAILTKHIRIHTGETPFACSVCGKRFKVKSGLTSHMLTHTGEKLFSCEVCKTAFPRKNALVTHMKIHSGEKEFACDVCNKYFRHKHVRNNHVLHVHKVNVGSVGKNNK